MLPNNALSTDVVKGNFNYPNNLTYRKGTDYEMGGVALQDPSLGLNYQPWKGVWNPEDNTVYLYPNMEGDPIPIFEQERVIDFSFAFDQNMRWAAVTIDSDQIMRLRWYDSVVEDYVISSYPNTRAAKISLDDKRLLQVQGGASDLILTYIRGIGGLCYRQQRDRYTIERILEPTIPSGLRITNFGMTDKYRMQWRLQSV